MARGQVLLKWQPVAKVAVARDGANPILLVEPFRLKMRRQEPVINVENKIKLPAFHEFCDAAPPGPEFKVDLIASVRVLPAQAGEHNCADVVRTGNAKVAILPHRIEETRCDQILHPG